MKVDGGTAEIVDAVDSLYGQFPLAIAIIVVATYLALLVQFRSILLPLKAVVMNTMSIVASYGARDRWPGVGKCQAFSIGY